MNRPTSTVRPTRRNSLEQQIGDVLTQMQPAIESFLLASIRERFSTSQVYEALRDDLTEVKLVPKWVTMAFRPLVSDRALKILDVCHCNDPTDAPASSRQTRFHQLWRDRIRDLAMADLKELERASGNKYYTTISLLQRHPEISPLQLFHQSQLSGSLDDFLARTRKARKAYNDLINVQIAKTISNPNPKAIQKERLALEL